MDRHPTLDSDTDNNPDPSVHLDTIYYTFSDNYPHANLYLPICHRQQAGTLPLRAFGGLPACSYTELNLQSIGTNQYGPPAGVTAVRDGNQVTISWEQVEMTKDKDRGYLIEAFVCQDGAYLWWTFSYPDQYSTSYTITDEPGCPAPSQGLLYTVEKHGFSKPVAIP